MKTSATTDHKVVVNQDVQKQQDNALGWKTRVGRRTETTQICDADYKSDGL